ncbi:MAG: hypothetical protein ABSH35_35090 [Isosphaeraceae bacterium]|jgi:uncharacterized Zn-binding protein involved in type VI secretion
MPDVPIAPWLAAHGFQPDLVCKSHWTAGKVGVRAHRAWDHEMFARDLGWSVFQCVAVPVVAQKSEMVAQKSEMVAQKGEMVAQKGEMVAQKGEMVAQKGEMVAQKSEMAVSPDRLADGHKSFIPKRLGCVP